MTNKGFNLKFLENIFYIFVSVQNKTLLWHFKKNHSKMMKNKNSWNSLSEFKDFFAYAVPRPQKKVNNFKWHGDLT